MECASPIFNGNISSSHDFLEDFFFHFCLNQNMCLGMESMLNMRAYSCTIDADSFIRQLVGLDFRLILYAIAVATLFTFVYINSR